MQMTRISIPVSVAERDALLASAERNLRHPRDEARHLLRCMLGLENPKQHESAVQYQLSNDGALVEVNP